ncbi:MAG: PQQ-dependent sugar dehydrogenase [Candidatus Hydrogenedentes bacterium]|nr:PQQ-dependent sugar dehydrogenase [Candidatus Hydrogenedentota bacterium]
MSHTFRFCTAACCFGPLAFSIAAYATASLNVTTQLVASGFSAPVFVTGAPGDTTRLFVLEQTTGRIRLIKNGVTAATPFLDIGTRVSDGGGERGLLGLAFHPDYATNRFFYVNYTDNNGDTIVERYKARTSFDRANKKGRTRILKIVQPDSNHNGGMMAFGPNDDYLYIGMGDGGGGGDPQNHGQRLNTLLGKFLRIDVDAPLPYGIPADNPFVTKAVTKKEIWSYGWRNPWRWSFDRETGDLWAGDVGQDDREEIDFQPADSTGGENYGWRVAEGFECLGGGGSCGDDPGFTPPLIDYGRLVGTTVVGGYVYRGAAIPTLKGTYFFADFGRSRIWTMTYDGNSVDGPVERTSELDPSGAATIGQPASFGEDSTGELYIVDYADGEIYKIVPE